MRNTKYLMLFFLSVTYLFGSCGLDKETKRHLSELEKIAKRPDNFSKNNSSKKIDSLLLILNNKTIEYQGSQGVIANRKSSKADKLKKEITTVINSLLYSWESVDGYSFTRPHISSQGRYCGTLDNASESSAVKQVNQSTYLDQHLQSLKVEIPIIFHMLSSSTGEGIIQNQGEILNNQIDTLNRYFKDGRISFRIHKVMNHLPSGTNEIEWYFRCGLYQDSSCYINDNAHMMKKLSISPSKFLNIYCVSSNGGKAMGLCNNFPWNKDYTGTHQDGVIIDYMLLPNQFSSSHGKTLVHEIGHYLGLLHTFHMNIPIGAKRPYCNKSGYSGCDNHPIWINNGDRVKDTPPQKYCFYDDDCFPPSSLDTCDYCNINKKDIVPTDNLMGYNSDRNMKRFTPGQFIRMKEIINKFRSHYIQEEA